MRRKWRRRQRKGKARERDKGKEERTKWEREKKHVEVKGKRGGQRGTETEGKGDTWKMRKTNNKK